MDYEELLPEQIEISNALMEYLGTHIDPDWDPIVQQHFMGPEYDAAIKSIHRACEAIVPAQVEPLGVYVGGTGAAKEGAELTGENAQVAVQALKDHNRLVQLGRGRGKLLILVSAVPLEEGAKYKAKNAGARRRKNVEAEQIRQELQEQIDELRLRLDDVATLLMGGIQP